MRHIKDVLADAGFARVKLALFDADGTLVRSFMREGGGADAYDLVEPLPGRREVLDALREVHVNTAIVTNQGGVAFGYQTTEQVYAKVLAIGAALGFEQSMNVGIKPHPEGVPLPCLAYVSYGHPNASDDYWRGFHERHPQWRKPGAGMIEQAMRDYESEPDETLFVGDMDSDREAARAAGVRYLDAEQFFGDPTRR